MSSVFRPPDDCLSLLPVRILGETDLRRFLDRSLELDEDDDDVDEELDEDEDEDLDELEELINKTKPGKVGLKGRQESSRKRNYYTETYLLLSELLESLPRFFRSLSRPRELRFLSLSESGDAIFSVPKLFTTRLSL